jgi:hypothetical protein
MSSPRDVAVCDNCRLYCTVSDLHPIDDLGLGVAAP